MVSHNKNQSRPQFDHFYPQCKYPYLAISIFNLIPSCSLCNLGKTYEEPEKFLYPYEESFEDKKIHFEISNRAANLLKKEDIAVTLEPYSENKSLIDIYNKSFKIELLYNQHASYITELVMKNHIFNDDAIESIYKSYEELFKSESELSQLLLGNCEIEDLNQKPLGKLTNDILNQLNK